MKHRKCYFLFLIVALFLWASCGENKSQSEEYMVESELGEPELRIAVASNMGYAMNELSSLFTAQTGVNVEVILGASGKLCSQIQMGAPYHIYMSADTQYPNLLERMGHCNAQTQVFAKGKIVIWTTRELNLDQWRLVLASEEVEKIAIANPRIAPYGKATKELLESVELYDKVESKLVTGENVSQASQFIQTGSVDVGFSSLSVALSPPMKGVGKYVVISDAFYGDINHGMVTLKKGEELCPEKSRKWREFMNSQGAIEIMQRFGFEMPEN